MREGKLLAEDAPECILSNLGCDTIEDAFLKLCEQSEISKDAKKAWNEHDYYNSKINCIRIQSYDPAQSLEYQKINTLKSVERNHMFKSYKKMKALLGKNLLSIIRRPA